MKVSVDMLDKKKTPVLCRRGFISHATVIRQITIRIPTGWTTLVLAVIFVIL
jgi:hypothetical protein